jgi:leucyl/phenylalanyl-tRNA--protein transferase
VLDPLDLHVPKSLRRVLNSGRFRFTLDSAFPEVIHACAGSLRPGQDGTWIVPEMIDAYTRLHTLGFAHSAECWRDDLLVGGMYGVSLGSVFFGESMFYSEQDASKALFATVVPWLHASGCRLIDCQQTTKHLLRFGAKEITRREFLRRVAMGMAHPTQPGKWSMEQPVDQSLQ